MKTIITSVLFFFSIATFGQKQQPLLFKKKDYPASKFYVTTDTSYLQQIQIIITMVNPKKNAGVEFLCHSFLTIKKNNKVLKHKFYDIDPVGGCSGLYLPVNQPIKNLFIISKFGDYEGETLIIDTAGKLTELAGGSFSITPDKSYLISVWNSDLQGITVYDLLKRKTILNKEVEEELNGDIHYQDGKYYVSYYDNITLGQISIESRKIISTKKTKGFLKKASKLKVYNDVQTLPACNCGKE